MNARIVTVFMAVCALAPRLSRAQDRVDTSVEAEHRRGIEARLAHRDVEARDIFARLYALTREPRALARQALAEGAMGEWVAAEEHLVTALEAREDPWIQANRAIPGGLDENLTLFRAHLASLDVVCRAPAAELWMNGARVGALPLARPVRVTAGEVSVEVRAPGHEPRALRERLDAGLAPRRIEVDLRPVSPPPSVGVVTPVRVDPPPRPAVIVRRVPRPWVRPVSVTSLSLGAVGVGLGVAMVLVAQGNEARFDANGCREYPRGARSDCDGLEDDTRGLVEPAAVAGFVAGGALLVTGIVLWLAGPTTVTTTRALARCEPGSIGLRCAFDF
jgi:hypothetical protein